MPVKRWSTRVSRKPRLTPSVAERQMIAVRERPLVLPEGADPELAKLIGLEVRDV